MKIQRGGALIVVLAVLTASLVIGVSGMKSSTVDERLSANYRAALQAQMVADSGLSGFLLLDREEVAEVLDSLLEDAAEGDGSVDLVQVLRDRGKHQALDPLFGNLLPPLPDNFDSLSESAQNRILQDRQDLIDALAEKIEMSPRFLDADGNELTLSDASDAQSVDRIEIIFKDRGLRSGARRDATLVFERVGGAGPGSPALGIPTRPNPFDAAVVGCQGVTLTGSGYLQGGDVLTVDPGAPLSITGNSPIQRNLYSTGDFLAAGSSAVEGDIYSNGNIRITANTVYGGSMFALGRLDVENSAEVLGALQANLDMTFTNVSTVHGDVSSGDSVTISNTSTKRGHLRADGQVTFTNGAVVEGSVFSGTGVAFNHSGARVQGDVNAPSVTTNHRSGNVNRFVQGDISNNPHTPHVPVEAFVPPECDPLSLAAEVAPLQQLESNGAIRIGAWPKVDWEVTPQEMRAFDETWNVKDWSVEATAGEAEWFGQNIPVIRTGNLNLQNGELVVRGGHVTLFVDGNLSFGGGGPGLVIEEGSSLSVVVSGVVTFGSIVQMDGVPAVTDGLPTFALYSTHNSGSGNGVVVEGNARLVANLYAPYTGVAVSAGGGLDGSIRGRVVSVTGGGGVRYDASVGGGGSGSESSPWCDGFGDLAPLTVVQHMSSFKEPDSNITSSQFDGRDQVPSVNFAANESLTIDKARNVIPSISETGVVRGFPPGSIFRNRNDANQFRDFIDAVNDYVQREAAGNSSVTRLSNPGSLHNASFHGVTWVAGAAGRATGQTCRNSNLPDGASTVNIVKGSGLMVIDGSFHTGGNPEFDGLIIVLGDFSVGGGGGGDV